MITIIVRFEDGDHLVTRLNGTFAQAQDYYVGRYFNLGTRSDRMVKAVSIERM